VNFRAIRYSVGRSLQVVGVSLILPIICAAVYREDVIWTFVITAIVFLVTGSLLSKVGDKPKGVIRSRDGFAITVITWIIITLLGCLPFYISGEIPSFTDAVFETASGFTTTGATILDDVEALSRSMLLWRSFTHWLGGMGVLVLMMIFVKSSADEMNIMKAESPGPSVDKIVPSTRKTALMLYAIYTVLTIVTLIALLIAGMPLFDSICMAVGTAGTGGFGIVSDSAASYSPACQIILTVAMIIFGANFKIYYLMVMKKFRDILKCEEVLWYIVIYSIATALVCVSIASDFATLGEALRHASFQVASVMTTAGYSTVDFNLWPTFAKAVLLLVMFTGACAGSTAGGIKISRIAIYIKEMLRETASYIHPGAVRSIRLDGSVVSKETLRSTNVYLIAYGFIFILSLLVVCTDGYDFETCFTAVLTTLNNVGPGLSKVGPLSSFSCMSNLSKWVLTFDMITGRLEIFPVIICLMPATWRRP